MNSDNSKRRGWFSLYAPFFLWIGVIFLLSSGSGSLSATSKFIRPLLLFLFPNSPEETIQLMHFYIRKAAHFTEYAILALLAMRAFTKGAVAWLKAHPYIFSILLVTAIALLDEFNQSFNPARTGSGWDSAIDISGGIVALAVWYLTTKLIERRGKNLQG